jgi:hypothetical protein
VQDISHVLSPGMVVQGVVIAVRKDKLTLDVSLRESDLERKDTWWVRNRHSNQHMSEWWAQAKKGEFDRYFNEAKASEDLEMYINQQLETAKKLKEREDVIKNSFFPRTCYHPVFKNFTYVEAEKYLAGKGAGEVVVRPSSKGPDQLSITWAFQEGWYKHIEVKESEKRPGEKGLGRKLSIAGEAEPFGDLDEILANYITPMNDLITQILAHKSFHPGDPDEVEEQMKIDLKQNPSRYPYFIRFDKKYPGYFVLTWLIPESSVPLRKEFIAVRPAVIIIVVIYARVCVLNRFIFFVFNFI